MAGKTEIITEPISPELVLIDAELAVAARALLPDYSSDDCTRLPPHPVEESREGDPPVWAPAPPTEPLTTADDREVQLDPWEAKTPSSTWGIRAAVAVFVAALLSVLGFVVLGWRASANERPAAVEGGPAPSDTGPAASPVPETSTLAGSTTNPLEPEPSEPTEPTPTATSEEQPPPPPPPRSHPPPPPIPSGRPPGNVLGVVVTAGSRRVTLRWQRPTGAVAVIIVRRPGRDGTESTVYEGRRTSYVDRTVRNGIAYRYLIISRDRRGKLSSGVPTVVKPSGRS